MVHMIDPPSRVETLHLRHAKEENAPPLVMELAATCGDLWQPVLAGQLPKTPRGWG